MHEAYYVVTDPHGKEAVKRGEAAAFLYAQEHHCTSVDELTRRRVLIEDVAGWPVDPMKLWAWTPDTEQ